VQSNTPRHRRGSLAGAMASVLTFALLLAAVAGCRASTSGVARVVHRTANLAATEAATDASQSRALGSSPHRHRVVGSGSLSWPIPDVFRSTPETAQAAALVVAVTFQDQPEPTIPLSKVDNIYFGPGPDSVAGYFRWASYGAFQLHGTVVGGPAAGQSTAWLTLPHSRAFYAMGNSGMGTGAQANDAVGGDRLEAEVLKLLDAAHFNWAPYENAAGKVPYLILAVASPDAALTGNTGDLWSYEESGSDNPITLPNGTRSEILNYDMDAFFGSSLSTLNGLGTLCHEFSHILGALDLYDTNGSIGGLGAYSLMGTGNYNGPAADGADPSDEDAFTRLQFGWSKAVVVPDTLARAATVVTLPPAEVSPEVLEIPVPGTPFDYLIENRQPIGMDAYLPSHGLLVYRVDTEVASGSSAAWANDCLECVTGKGANRYPAVELLGAGGTGDLALPGTAGNAGNAADAYPGADRVTALTDATSPSDRLPTGAPSFIALTDIQQDPNGDITLVLSTTAASVTPGTVPAEAPATVSLTDPRTPPEGTTFRVDGVSVTATAAGTDAVRLSVPPLPAGVAPVERMGTSLPIAYLLVVPSPGPLRLRITAPTQVRSGAPFSVRVSLLNGSGVPVVGNFGPVEVDGTTLGTLETGSVQGELTISGGGVTDLTARLVDAPNVVATVSVSVHVVPARVSP